MIEPDNFEIAEEHAAFRPTGQVTIEQAIQLVADGIASAKQRGICKLMVNICGLTGFESPPIGLRYFFVREWAQIACGTMCIAMVAPQEIIDPQKFGITAAANAGLTANVFTSEQEAFDWLQSIA